MTQNTSQPVHWMVRLNHLNRSGSFALLFAAIGSHLLSQDVGPLAWSLLALQFLVYPHLVYWRALRSRDGMRTELNNMVIDSVLLGAWAAALQFPLWISYAILICTTINLTVYRGRQGFVSAIVAIACGALATIAVLGLKFSPHTDWPSTALTMVCLSLYLLIVANVAFTRNLRLSEARNQLHQQLEKIHALQSQLSEQANRDPLTGLYNRRYLDSTLLRELARCERDAEPLSLMLIDIDHFKQVNDTYGHLAGDEVLKNLATLLNEQARSADVVCRFGGEEFLLVLPNMPPAVARARADQWRTAFAARPIVVDTIPIQATLSIGIASYPEHGTSPQTLIRCADQALYRAKSQGRNRVVSFESPHAPQ